MRRLFLVTICLLAGFCSIARPALADKRVALVIGNSAYQTVPKLPNPANDAGAVAELLRAAKFDVVESRRDLGIVEMRRAFRDFSDKTRDADIAVVYYAGHGIEIEGINYLIPVDAVLQRDADAYDEAITLDRALQVIEPARQLRLVILDACRDNPFARSMKRTVASRSIGRGLAGVEPGKANTLIAFAAKGGSSADDGNGAHSPFTTALLQHLTTPGLDIRRALGKVRDEVMKATGDRQEPFVYGSLGGSDVSLVPAPTQAAPAAAAQGPSGDPQDRIRRDYELALQVATRDGWQAFLQQYPNGFYANLANAQLNKIAAEEARAAAVDKARQAEADKARLAAERATAAAQARAAADAKAAEDARVAAEKLKQEQQAKADAAERARAAAEAKAAEDAKKTEPARIEQKPADQKPAQVAALPPPGAADTAKDTARALQTELRRVGCFTANVDGDWKTTSQRSIEQFNKFSGMKLDARLASLDAIDAVKSKTSRVCPLICDHGFRADGEACVRITCKSGYQVGDDNTCEKIETRKSREKPAVAAKPAGNAAEKPTQAPSGCANIPSSSYLFETMGCGHKPGAAKQNAQKKDEAAGRSAASSPSRAQPSTPPSRPGCGGIMVGPVVAAASGCK